MRWEGESAIELAGSHERWHPKGDKFIHQLWRAKTR